MKLLQKIAKDRKIYINKLKKKFMTYDLFTHDKNLADKIRECYDKIYSDDATTKPTMFDDTTAKPTMYQFFDITNDDLKGIMPLLENVQEQFELKGSEKGELIWPNEHGLTLEQAVDLI